jgi:type I restriction enzyme S subunit
MKNTKWTWKRIDSLFEIDAGKTMSARARNGQVKTPFLRTSNVLWDQIDLSALDSMEIPEDELKRKTLKKGDLLVCEGGEIGRAAIWSGELETVSFQNHLHRLRPGRDDVNPHFYVYFLQAAFTRLGIFEGAGNRTTIPNLSRNRLAELEIPHPPLNEQIAIAEVLKCVRAGSKTQDQIIESAQQLKDVAMRNLFTRGLRGEAQRDTDAGLIPISWDIQPLTSVCLMQSGGTPPKSDPSLWHGTHPWVSGKDLKVNRLVDSIDHISEEAAQTYSKIAPSGSVLVLVRGMGLINGFALSLIDRPMAFNQDLKALIPSGTVNGPFLMHALTYAGKRMLQNVSDAAHGTKRLGQSDLDSFMIPVPPPDEQREISSILDAIDQKIELHKRKRVALRELFQTLLHTLMTGELTVSELNLSALNTVDPVEMTV